MPIANFKSQIDWLVLAALLMMAGCQTARVGHPLTQDLAGNAAETQMDFWHTLAGRPVTSYDEAFHGLLLYLDGRDGAQDYAGRVAELRLRKMLPSGFSAPAGQAVDRGTLAYAIVRALQIKGGWVMHVFGNSPRYAIKELEYEGVYPPSSPNQTFSGSEFVGVIGKMEDYQREHAGTAKSKA